ncbi:alpha/beta hydrolase family protein [Halotalea alkalilenta]|uniref:alpha/beta hydrolase family protein n=1 Tax=Halotalea alkalilenta TaxID=376489 RepID=UPI0009DF2DE9|nr:prolyl oligopeptidase family serine peptidase [Halotalea alkalilenta]
MKFKKAILIASSSIILMTIGAMGATVGPKAFNKLSSIDNLWDDTRNRNWDDRFERIVTPERNQPAYIFKSTDDSSRPLIVSLHTWSGGYDQNDPLSILSADNNWNYIHPHTQGPNNNSNACLGSDVIDDINDAISYSLNNMNVDMDNIIIIGASGGGYATLGAYLKEKIPAKAYIAWVPISDLGAWYWQSKANNRKYADDIFNCTRSIETLNQEEVKARSPLRWELEDKRYPSLIIYAGLNDGYQGAVPISHSILFYNKMVKHEGGDWEHLVSAEQTADLLTRAASPSFDKFLGDRGVFYERNYKHLSLKIFDGGHEMLPEYAAEEIRRIVEN